GFPGIPVAITMPNCTMTLLDSTRKKINFINESLTQLTLSNVKTLVGRAEEIGHYPQHRKTYDVALIRAVGNPAVCAEYTLPLLKQGGLAVIYRGNWTEEETKSLQNAVNQLGGIIESLEQFTTPLTNSVRHCLYLRKVVNTPANFPRGAGVATQKPL
ncbi:MAG: 16S rRNA (guanine(527)-N(7))-methyltransferase RsmG, partial [Nodularia sp. (in: Bacteria)]